MPKLNFQEQMDVDLDRVFFNAGAMEFVTQHMIGGIRGKPSIRLDVVADHELYKERSSNNGMENTSLDGIVIFIKKAVWSEAFGNIPKAGSAIKFDSKDYQIEALDDDMGMLELTLSSSRG